MVMREAEGGGGGGGMMDGNPSDDISIISGTCLNKSSFYARLREEMFESQHSQWKAAIPLNILYVQAKNFLVKSWQR